jgi:hypothetical protein
MTKWSCLECFWRGMDNELLVAPSPFDPDDTLLYACPECKDICNLRQACDYPGCWSEATCGWYDGQEYRQTCPKHMTAWKH